MRIFFNALQAGNQSGTGRYCTELIKALADSPDCPELHVAWPEGLQVPVESDGIKYHENNADTLKRLIFDQYGYKRICQSESIDRLHYPANFGAIFPAAPTIVTVHDLTFLRHPDWFPGKQAAYYRFMAVHSLPKAKLILADSESTADDLHSLLHIPWKFIRVIPLGVDHDRFKPQPKKACNAVRERYGLPETFLLYAGAIEPRKNLPRLVEAWSQVAEDMDCDLVLAGRQAWKGAALQQALAASPHRDRIHLPGFIDEDDLPALMSAARGFVYPSIFEGFGLPPLEAMACGTPVLASTTGSLPEVLGSAAYLVEPENTAMLADGLTKLAKPDSKRVKAGIERAQRYTWQFTAEKVIQAYLEH